MHEVAAFSELALVLLVEYLAAARAVEFASAPSVSCAQFFDSVGEPTPVLIGTVSLFHKVFAELHLDLVLARLRRLEVLWG